ATTRTHPAPPGTRTTTSRPREASRRTSTSPSTACARERFPRPQPNSAFVVEHGSVADLTRLQTLSGLVRARERIELDLRFDLAGGGEGQHLVEVGPFVLRAAAELTLAPHQRLRADRERPVWHAHVDVAPPRTEPIE